MERMDPVSLALGAFVASLVWWTVLYFVVKAAVSAGTANLVKQNALVLQQNELSAKFLSTQTDLLAKIESRR